MSDKDSSDTSQGAAVRLVEVDEGSAGQRLDNFLMRFLKGVPRSRIYRIIRKGEVRVNRGRARADTRLATGDSVRIPPVRVASREQNSLPKGLQPLEMVAEEPDLLVVNKPAGIAVHGGSGIQLGLIERLRLERPKEELELVHRLDRDTSGLLLVARRRKALRDVQRWFQETHSGLKKEYLAVVHGEWSASLTEVRAPIAKNRLQGGERFSRVAEDGQYAETHFERLAVIPLAALRGVEAAGDGTITLIKATLVTGRTHQIRVHCQFNGHPIVGDDRYELDEFAAAQSVLQSGGYRGMLLHAWRMRLPDGRRFEAKPQKSLEKIVSKYM